MSAPAVPYTFAKANGIVVTALAGGTAEVAVRAGAHAGALAEVRRALGVPIALIWDRLAAHIGEPVAAWLVRNRHRIRAHLLPPYAPELNPVELIWGHTKSNPLANFAPSELEELLDQTQLATLAIGDDEPMLRSFLRHCPLSLRLK